MLKWYDMGPMKSAAHSQFITYLPEHCGNNCNQNSDHA